MSSTQLRERMQQAASDPELAQRLAMVHATVLIAATGDDDAGVWLRFGGDGLEVGEPPAEGDADIRLWMEPELLNRFPFFHVSLAVADGRVAVDGPVRRVLEVVPVLRTAVENGRKVAEVTG